MVFGKNHLSWAATYTSHCSRFSYDPFGNFVHCDGIHVLLLMLTADDIKTIVASGEGYNAEFKVALPSKVKEVTEEICAFANAAGGHLLLETVLK